MMITEKELDLIDRHLRHELNPDEVSDFENLKSNADFAAVLEERRNIQLAVESKGRDKLRSVLESWALESPKIKKTPWFRWAIAAGLVLLLGTYLLKPSLDIDLTTYDTPFPDIISELNRSTKDPKSTFGQLFQSYNQGDWTAAEKRFEEFNIANPREYQVYLYSGISSYHAGHFQRAINKFDKIFPLAKDHTFTEPAQWFKALSYIKNGDISTGKQMLTKISSSSHYKRLAAKRLLDIL